MASRIEKVVVHEPPFKPADEVLFEIVRGPTSGTRNSGMSYTEWCIYVPESQAADFCRRRAEAVSGVASTEHYEACIMAGMSLEDALISIEAREK